MSKTAPKLWSDFDGTAVAIAKKTNPRNWSKYPLPGIEGYADFLRGVSSTGVEIAGVVSRRPDFFIRRMATARSIAKLGYGEFFPRPEQIVHRSSDEAKGRFLAEESRAATIGMLEDKPHKLGAILLGALSAAVQPAEIPHNPILIGVVSHKDSQRHIGELARQAELGGLKVTETGPMTAIGMDIKTDHFALQVVQLRPYSVYSGEDFGNRLQALLPKTV